MIHCPCPCRIHWLPSRPPQVSTFHGTHRGRWASHDLHQVRNERRCVSSQRPINKKEVPDRWQENLSPLPPHEPLKLQNLEGKPGHGHSAASPRDTGSGPCCPVCPAGLRGPCPAWGRRVGVAHGSLVGRSYPSLSQGLGPPSLGPPLLVPTPCTSLGTFQRGDGWEHSHGPVLGQAAKWHRLLSLL